MIQAYRLFRSRYKPWDATGAKRWGGRWNSPGEEVIYTSDSLSLACLEVLVHIRDPYFVPTCTYCVIDIPESETPAIEAAYSRYWGPTALSSNRSSGKAMLQVESLSRVHGDFW